MERNRGTILVLDCFVVPPRNDGKGEPPRIDGKVGSSWRGTKPSSSESMLDCFVVPPRNDGKGSSKPAPSLRTEGEAIQKMGATKEDERLDCFVVPPRNDGKGSTNPAPSLRTEAEAIQFEM